MMKRAVDMTLSALGLVLLAPVFLIIALMIRISSPGPVLFRQQRVGRGLRPFIMLKFRTMSIDAERGGLLTVTDDPRVTSVGRVLRKSKLDEIPQLLNVLRGDMSLVGPRALDVEEHRALEESVRGFNQRLLVLPGLTGLAQIYDQTDIAMDKFRYDLEYLQTMNMWLDLRLLTLSVLNTVGARWDRRVRRAMEIVW